MNLKWKGLWDFTHKRAGKVIYEAQDIPNALVDEGEESVLDTYFRAQSAPAQFYVGLGFGAVSETDGLADLPGEPVGNGYARQLVARDVTGWPTLALSDGDFRVDSKQVTFAASGGSIGPVNYAFLATTLNNTGKLIAFITLPIERTILDGDEGLIVVKVKLQ